eukprot:9484313-Pyramimonas_sp.AAC.1
MQQTNAPDHTGSITCAYQLCSCPVSRDKSNIPRARIKMTRNGRSRLDAFWQHKVPDRAEIKMASGNKIEDHGKKTRDQTNG